MKIGIIGTPQVGKSTVFRLLSGIDAEDTRRGAVGVAKVPDGRVNALAKMYLPKKTTYATIELRDLPGLTALGKGSSFEVLRDLDAFVQVVRAFSSDLVPPEQGEVDPVSELEGLQSEMIMADWAQLENLLERAEKMRQKRLFTAAELSLLARCRTCLEQELPIYSLGLDAEETRQIAGYNFLTVRPLIVVVNVDEEQLQSGEFPQRQQLEEWSGQWQAPLVVLSGQVELEINQLGAEDRMEFMADFGLKESGIARLAQAVYAHIGLVSFFTVGSDEVKAWTIVAGTTARKAAGKVHSDIERGFIRAEVTSYQELVEYGTMGKLKELGRLRLEGKDYRVQDGDIISFRFNV